ncbi:helix-turn-helix transcriptional regulator [Mycobacterium sp. M26]|uniref:helix-turn-helix domain-containing protein n=1 Tax=Mycobacterium sp. M26 TaxID=1762962 RepID=UPI000A48062A|nr:helix-turn-helix transcriptional regulator [Mycobacterium sp. M26]
MADYPDVPNGARWSVSRVFFPAGDYDHPPTGLLQLRVVRRGSSYAYIDLGAGLRRVYTRPGDLLLSLPDRPTAFRIDDGRELTLLQVDPSLADHLVRQAGGGDLDDLAPLLRGPARDAVVAELARRLEGGQSDTEAAQMWSLGVIVANVLRLAQGQESDPAAARLTSAALAALLADLEQTLAEPWTVDRMAEHVGLPRRVFAAAFKEATSLPAHQYLMRLRADQAAELLGRTDLPIAAIAHMTGFSGQPHLTRCLKQLKGTTPGEIRRSQPDRGK